MAYRYVSGTCAWINKIIKKKMEDRKDGVVSHELLNKIVCTYYFYCTLYVYMQLIVICNECIYPNNPECDWILSDIARTWSLFSPLHPCDWMAHCIIIWWRFNTAEKMPPCFQYVGENLDGKQNSKQSMNDQVVSLEFFFYKYSIAVTTKTLRQSPTFVIERFHTGLRGNN